MLIILAGVAINLTLGDNGIFYKAKYAKQEYLNAKGKEDTELAKAEDYIESARDTVTIPKSEYEKLQLINKPNKWEVGTEYDFGDGVYGQRFVGNGAKNITITLIDSGIKSIINQGGIFWHGGPEGSELGCMVGYRDATTGVQIQLTHDKLQLKLWDASTGPYDVWIIYMKN